MSTLYPSVPAIWEGTGRSCLAQEQPTGDGILPHGRPRRWGIAVPHSVLRLPPLPGCRAIGQGCHPFKKTLLVGRTWLCTLGCRIAPSSEPGHLCTSLQLPWTWPDAPRSGASQRGSDHDEPHAKARQSSGGLCWHRGEKDDQRDSLDSVTMSPGTDYHQGKTSEPHPITGPVRDHGQDSLGSM